MKRLSILTLALLVIAAPAWAQMMGHMYEQGETESGYPGYGWGPGMMGGYGGWGGHMMGPGMMGAYGGWDSKEFKEFLDETKDMRRKLHGKMFEYMELWRTKASRDEIEKAEKEINELQKQIYKKSKDIK